MLLLLEYDVRICYYVYMKICGCVKDMFHVDNDELATTLNKLCYHSARLYNTAIYNFRQHYFETGKRLPFRELSAQTRINENYSFLICDMADQTINKANDAIASYYALKDLVKENKYDEKKVKLPGYLDKEGLYPAFVAGRSARLKEDGIHVSITQKFRDEYKVNLKELVFPCADLLRAEGVKIRYFQIKPLYGGRKYRIYTVYEKEEGDEEIKLDRTNVASIDLGLKNLMCVYNNTSNESFLIDGSALISVNAFYNKKKASLQSVYDKSGLPYDTIRMAGLYLKRSNFIDSAFDLIVKRLVDYCLSRGIGTVVVGQVKGWKDGINLGKNTNQKFVSIPYDNLKRKLSGKCINAGIDLVFVDEAHTSKCSALDLEPVSHHEKYVGKRVKRGLFISEKGIPVNADLNACLNIYRKWKKDVSVSVPDMTQERLRAASASQLRRIKLEDLRSSRIVQIAKFSL